MTPRFEDLRDANAESGVIATLVFHPEFIVHSEHLKSRHFTDMTYRILYWAIGELFKKGITNIDEINLLAQINSEKEAEKRFRGDLKTINSILKHTGSLARSTLSEYKLLANKIVELAFKRDLYRKLQELKTCCLNKDVNLGDLYRKVNKELDDLSNTYLTRINDVSLFGDIVDSIWEKICSRRNKDGTYGYKWKFEILNQYCPIEKGELIVISGQEKKGKSTVMLNQLVQVIKDNIPCLYVDTELQEAAFLVRLLSCMTQIPAWKIKSGNYLPSEEEMLKIAMEEIKQKPFMYRYLPDADMDTTYTLCRTLQNKINLQILFFDYIKDVESKDNSRQYNRLGYMTNYLKNEIAGALDIAVIAGAQLNRQEEIADSIKIARYASTIIKVAFKDDKRIVKDGEQCGNYMMWVDINRNGNWHNVDDDEYIDMIFKGETFTVDEAPVQHTQPSPF